jgi:hypothetical protein
MTKLSDEELVEIIDGTIGVTPGPWYWDEGGLRTEWDDQEHIIWPVNAIPGENLGACGRLSEPHAAVNAAHIARLSPERVRSMASELRDVREKVARYEAALAAIADRWRD